jgi:hypothetical protein
MQYRLRTLLILLAVLPPLLCVVWTKYEAWRAEQARRAARVRLQTMPIAIDFAFPIAAQPQVMNPPAPAESETEFSFYMGITR